MNAAPIPMPTDGVHPEINQSELPPTAMFDAENWIFRDGRMRVRTGVVQLGTTTGDRPNGFFGYIDDSDTPVLLMGTDDDVFYFNDTTQDWVSLSASYTAAIADSTLFEAFSLGTESGPVTTVYIQNGKDLMKKWTLTDPTVTSVTAAPTARAMMVLADRLILGNIIDNAGSSYAGDIGPAVVTVSASLNPEAGYDLTDGQIIQLLDTPGSIVGMQEIGNLQGIVYKTDAIYLLSASDLQPFTVELKRAFIQGPVSPRAIVAAQDGLHYYLARDGNVMVFDGVDAKPLGRHIHRYILNTWDPDTAYKAHGLYDDENRELVFHYPGVGQAEPNRKIVVRLDDMSLWPGRYADLRITAATKASLPGGTTIGQLSGDIGSQSLTLGEYSSLGQTLLLGDAGGITYGEGGTLDGTGAIAAFFETGATDFGDPLSFKSMRYIDHQFTTADDTQDVDVTLRGTNYGEDLVDDSTRTLEISVGGPYRTHHRFPKRNYALRVETDATETVEWQGATAVYARQGLR